MPFHRSLAVALMLCLTAGSLHAQDTQPAASGLYEKVRAAYDATQTYQAEQTFEISRMEGRWRMIQTFHVGFDRSDLRLLIDQPQVAVVHEGGKLFVKPGWAPGQHMEVPIRGKISKSKLLRAAPYLEQPPIPDIAMLLGSEPVDDRNVTELPADAAGRGQLLFDTPNGRIVLSTDPKTHLVQELAWQLSGAMLDNGNPDEAVTARMTIDVKQHNKPLPDDLFNHDWGTRLAMQPGLGNNDDVHAQAKAMEGQPAPPVQLRDLEGKIFELAAVDAKVIVLDFWATWCVPCEVGLAELATVNQWAKDQNLSVQIVAVNRVEEKDEVAKFWKDKGYGFKTVLDTHDLVSNAYRVSAIPHTVFIHNGKVAVVQIGTGRGAAEHYKEIITDLLADKDES